MDTTIEPRPIEFAERDPSPTARYRPARTPDEIDSLLATLKAKPGDWAIYSEHTTRGSARQRVLQLRKSVTFAGHPLEWRTQRKELGNPDSPVQILVSWKADQDASTPS